MYDDGELLRWRIEALEKVEAAIRHELYELRRNSAMREEVYSRDQARNVFMTRKELAEASARHRQWPVILGGITVAIVSVTDLILRLSGSN